MASKKVPRLKKFTPSDKENIGSWFRNASKSLGYVIQDKAHETAPNIGGTVTSSIESARAGLDMLKSFKEAKGAKAKANLIMNGKADDYITKGIKLKDNIFEDLRTGKLYNKERADKAMNAVNGFGDDFDFDFDFDDGSGDDSGFSVDMDFGDIDSDDMEDATVVAPNVTINSNINGDNPMVRSINVQTEITKSIAEDEAKRDYEIASAQMVLTKGIGTAVSGNLGIINENLTMMVNFNKDVIGQYVTASTQYYESSINIFGEMLTEIKKISSPPEKESRRPNRFDIGEILPYGGGLNVGEYFNKIKKNAKDFLSDFGLDAIFSMGSDTGIFDAMLANPLGLALGGLVNLITPKSITETINAVDEQFSKFLPAMLQKITGMSNDYGDILKQVMGKLFGVEVAKPGRVKLDGYERGAVPFDGITRRSIVEIIPTYLSQILFALESSPALGVPKDKSGAMVYDWENGTYTTYKSLRKQYYDDDMRGVVSSYDMDLTSDLHDLVESTIKLRATSLSDTERAAKIDEVRRKIDGALYKAALSDKIIDPTTSEGLKELFNEKTDKRNANIFNTLLTNDDFLTETDIINLFESYKSSVQGKSRIMDLSGAGRFDARARMVRNIDEMNYEGGKRELAGTLFGGMFERSSDSSTSSKVSGVDEKTNDAIQKFRDWMNRRGMTSANIETISIDEAPPSGYESIKRYLDPSERKLIERYEKRREESGKGFVNKLKSSTSGVRESIGSILEAPTNAVKKLTGWASELMYTALFGKDGDGEKGTDDKDVPLGQRILYRITRLGDSIKEGLFDDEKGFFGKIKNSEFYKGLTAKGEKAKEWLTDFISGPNGLFGGMISSFKETGAKVKDSVWSSLKSNWSGIKDTFGAVFGSSSDKSSVAGETVSFGERLRGGFQTILDTLFGTDVDENGKVNSKVRADKILTTLKDGAPDAAAKGILGGLTGAFLSSTATGLLSGLVIGPIGGAAIGIGASFLSRSEKFKSWMFGEQDPTTGSRIGGIISKQTQDFFKDRKNDIIGGATIGGIGGGVLGIGLLPGMVLGGPISGALLGIAGALTVKSNAFQKFMFGDLESGGTNEGAISRLKSFFGSKDNQDTMKHLGGIGVGGLAGFGLLSLLGINPVLGGFTALGAAIAASSKPFKEFLFGTDDPNKPKVGLVNSFKDTMKNEVINPIVFKVKETAIDLANWFDNDILKYIIDGSDSFIEGMRFAGESVRRWFKDTTLFKSLAENIGQPIKDIASGIFSFVKGALGKATDFVTGALKKVIETPVKLVSKVVQNVVNSALTNSLLKNLRQSAFDNLMKSPLGTAINKLVELGGFINQGISKLNSFMMSGLKYMITLPFKLLGNTAKGLWGTGKNIVGAIGNSGVMQKYRSWRTTNANARLLNISMGNRGGFQSIMDLAALSNPFSGTRRYGDLSILGSGDEDGDFFAAKYLRGLNERRAKRDADREERNRKRQAKKDAIRNAGDKADKYSLANSLLGDEVGNLSDEEKDRMVNKILGNKYAGMNKLDDKDKIAVKQTETLIATQSDMKDVLHGDLTKIHDAIVNGGRPSKGSKGAQSDADGNIIGDLGGLYNNVSDGLNTDNNILSNMKDEDLEKTPTAKVMSAGIEKSMKSMTDEKKDGILSPLIKSAKTNFALLGPLVKGAGAVAIGLLVYRLLAFVNGWDNKVTQAMDKVGAAVGDIIVNKLVPAIREITMHAVDAINEQTSYADDDAQYDDVTGAINAYKVGVSHDDEALNAARRDAAAKDGSLMAAYNSLKEYDSTVKTRSGSFDSLEGVWQKIKYYGSTGNLYDSDNTINAQNERLSQMQFMASEILESGVTLTDAERSELEGIVGKSAKKKGFWDTVGEGVAIGGSTVNKYLPFGLVWKGAREWLNDRAAEEHGESEAATSLRESVAGIKKSDLEVGNAVGNSNIPNNKITKVHSGEGILTKAANHMFGNSATTAEILNEYARRGLNVSEGTTDPISVMQGTLGSSKFDGLRQAIYGDNIDTAGLEDYITKVREDSLTVSDSSYWKYDESEAGELGGIAEAMFKITRFVNYPARLINKTMGNMSADLKETEKEVEITSAEIENSSIIGKAKDWVSTTVDNIKTKVSDFVTGVKDGIEKWLSGEDGETTNTSAASTIVNEAGGMANLVAQNKNTGGPDNVTDVGFGLADSSSYYKFPSGSTIKGSDFDPSRVHPVSGKVKPHKGIDVQVRKAASDGYKYIRATTDGVIDKVSLGYSGGFGNTVRLKDPNGMMHLFAHMRDGSVNVKAGQSVKRGDILGIMGTTGSSTGEHLHYEVGDAGPGNIALVNNIHPAAYLESYLRGDNPIKTLGVDNYTVGSFWDDTATGVSSGITNNGTSSGYSSSSTSGSSSSNFLDTMYGGIIDFNNALTDVFNTNVKGTSSSSSSNYGTSYASSVSSYDTPITIKDNANAEKLWRAFRGLGYSKEATAAIIGNLMQEAGENLDPAQHQLGGGVGRGLKQWTVSQAWKNNVIPVANELGVDPFTLEAQIETIRRELDGSISKTNGGDKYNHYLMTEHYGGLEKFRTTNDIEWATKVFERSHEISGDAKGQGDINFSNVTIKKPDALQNRINSAKGAYNAYSDAIGGPVDIDRYATDDRVDYESYDNSTRPTRLTGSHTSVLENLIGKAIRVLQTIASNTAQTADNTKDISTQVENVTIVPSSDGTSKTATPNNEMYNIANRSRQVSTLKGKYDVAKAIAHGGV